jgi:hypothetical protein
VPLASLLAGAASTQAQDPAAARYTEPLDAGTLKEISTLPRKLAGAMRAVAGGRARPQPTLVIGSVRYCKSYLMVLDRRYDGALRPAKSIPARSSE